MSVLLCFGSCGRFANWYRWPLTRHWWSFSFCHDWITALVGLRAYLVHRLQSVLNASVRMIFQLRRSDHITDALVGPHWLYKINVLAYKVIQWTVPLYMGQLVRELDLPGRRNLRYASTARLVVPLFKLSTIGSRTFTLLLLRHGTNCLRI